MARRAKIPKFGSWDSSDRVGTGTNFTGVFDDARASRAAGNSDSPRKHLQNGVEKEVRRVKSRSSDLDTPGRKPSTMELPAHRIQVDSRHVPRRQHSDNGLRMGHSHSVNEAVENGHHVPHRSPLHRYHSHLGNRVGSPAWERKEGSATPGRSRLRNNSIEPVEKGGTLPKFGAWDANDPTSGDGFTVIFNNARNEKKAGAMVHVPAIGFDGSRDKDLYPGRTVAPQSKPSSKLLCCFQPTVTEA